MSNKRTQILLLALVLVSALSYPVLKKDPIDPSELPEAHMPGGGVDLSAYDSVNRLLSQIQSVNLDLKSLGNRQLAELIDFGLPLINIPIGKANPFADWK